VANPPTQTLQQPQAATVIHVRAFNLSLIFRHLLGAGTPREWCNRGGKLLLFLYGLFTGPQQPIRPCRNPNCRSHAISYAKPILLAGKQLYR